MTLRPDVKLALFFAWSIAAVFAVLRWPMTDPVIFAVAWLGPVLWLDRIREPND